MLKNAVLVGLDFGGAMDGTAVCPRTQRWYCYQTAGYQFPREMLDQAHSYVSSQILSDPNRFDWSLVVATEEWFVYEAQYLGIDPLVARELGKEHAIQKLQRLLQARSGVIDLAQDYNLILISNNIIGNLARVLAEAGMESLFHLIVDASGSGYRKPDPRVFHEVQRRAGVADSILCWYLGDQLQTDIGGALSAGWNAAWLVKSQVNTFAPSNVLTVNSLSEFHYELNKRYKS